MQIILDVLPCSGLGDTKLLAILIIAVYRIDKGLFSNDKGVVCQLKEIAKMLQVSKLYNMALCIGQSSYLLCRRQITCLEREWL